MRDKLNVENFTIYCSVPDYFKFIYIKNSLILSLFTIRKKLQTIRKR